jgi:hypothetical protein
MAITQLVLFYWEDFYSWVSVFMNLGVWDISLSWSPILILVSQPCMLPVNLDETMWLTSQISDTCWCPDHVADSQIPDTCWCPDHVADKSNSRHLLMPRPCGWQVKFPTPADAQTMWLTSQIPDSCWCPDRVADKSNSRLLLMPRSLSAQSSFH